MSVATRCGWHLVLGAALWIRLCGGQRRAFWRPPPALEVLAPQRPRGRRALELAGETCEETLVNYVCPPQVLEDGKTLCVPPGGWRVSSCELRSDGHVTLLAQHGTGIMVQVERGRKFILSGDFEFKCPDCKHLLRAISAIGASVEISRGRLRLAGFGLPFTEYYQELQRTGYQDFLQDNDGGAIVADSVVIREGATVAISSSSNDFGSGGAIAASQLVVEGQLIVKGSSAYLNGGAVALLGKMPGTDGFTLSWDLVCGPQHAEHDFAITGLSLSKQEGFFAASAHCCPVRVFSVGTGNEVWRSSAAMTADHNETCSDDLGQKAVWTADGRFLVVLHLNSVELFKFQDPENEEPLPPPSPLFLPDITATLIEDQVRDRDQPSKMAVSPSGQIIAWTKGASVGFVYLNDIHNGMPLIRRDINWDDRTDREVTAFDWCTEERGLLVMSDKSYLQLYDIMDLKVLKGPAQISISTFAIDRLACSPGGSRIYAAGKLSADGDVEKGGVPAGCKYSVDEKGGQYALVRDNQYFVQGEEVTAMAFHPQDRYFAWSTKGNDNTVTVHTEASGTSSPFIQLTLGADVTALAFSDLHRSQIYVGTRFGFVVVFDLEAKAEEVLDQQLLISGGATFLNSSAVEGDGGGLYATGATEVELANMHFVDCFAVARGGGLLVRGDAVSVENVWLTRATCNLGSNAMTVDYQSEINLRNVRVGVSGGNVVLTHKMVERPPVLVELSSSNVSCPPGHELLQSDVGAKNQDHQWQCSPCTFGLIFDPWYEACTHCPLGLYCDSKSDLSKPVLGTDVKSLPAPGTVDCDKVIVYSVTGKEVVAQSFFWNYSTGEPICYEARCLFPDSEMDFNGCESCQKRRGPGWKAQDGSICMRLNVSLVDGKVSVFQDRQDSNVKAAGSLTEAGKVHCELCPKAYTGPFPWARGTLAEEAGCKDAAAVVSMERGRGSWVLSFGVLRHGTVFAGTCNVSGFALDEVPKSFRIQYVSHWSFVAWSADLDNAFAVVATLTSTILVSVVILARGRLRRYLKLTVALITVLVANVVLGTASLMTLRADVDTQNTAWHQLAAAIFGLLVFLVAELGVRWSVEKRKQDELVDVQLEEALRLVGEVQFPVVVLSAEKFLSLGGLKPHEELRTELRFFDTVREVKVFFQERPSSRMPLEPSGVAASGSAPEPRGGHFGVFFSHQWTSYDGPDPTGQQYRVMCRALLELSAKDRRDVGTMYCWVDYFSIPQGNKHTQRLAINSLPVYASILQAFVIVAPEVQHSNTGLRCNRDSYQQRGWCRAEQLCHCVRRGTSDMYLADGGTCRPLNGMLGVFCKDRSMRYGDESKSLASPSKRPSVQDLEDWFTQSLYVFVPESHYSCCRMLHVMDGKKMPCDRQALMLPMLGLYAEIYRRRTEENYHEVYEDIKAERDRIFPPSFEYLTEKGSKDRLLFGDLLPRLERKMDRFDYEVSTQSSSLSSRGSDVAQGFRPVRFRNAAAAAEAAASAVVRIHRSLAKAVPYRSRTSKLSVMVNDVEMSTIGPTSSEQFLGYTGSMQSSLSDRSVLGLPPPRRSARLSANGAPWAGAVAEVGEEPMDAEPESYR